jgi:cellulose synthase (UDP-forming)
LRRSALQAVGGFATGTVTEDLHTSLRLHMQRFRSVYHAESLAFGLAPDTISAFLGQRIRWGEGAMKVWRSEGLLFNRRLSIPQRLNYFASVLTYFDGWQKLVFYVAPAIVLLTGLLPIHTTISSFLLHFIPYFILTLWIFEESSRGFGSFLQTEEYNMARFYAFARATLGWLGSGRKFKVTPKDEHGKITERNKIIPQYIVLTANLLAIPIGYLLYLHYQWLPAGGMYANIMWASVNAWLAYSLVTFTTHKNHQRLDYRFAVPVPAKICQQGKCRFGTIDDVSSSGFRLYARLAEGTRSGECLSGELWLPGRRLPFTAEIKRLVTAHDSSGDYTKAYGCKFNWQDHAMHDQLDRYLFGSGLQWQIQGLQESSRTPLQRLSNLRHGNRNAADNAPPCWAAFVYRMPGSTSTDEVAGLIEVAKPGQTRRKVLLYHPVNKGVLLSGQVITQLSEEDITLCATATRQIETQLTPVFMVTTEVNAGSVSTAEPVKVLEQVAANAEDASQDADAAFSHKRGLL